MKKYTLALIIMLLIVFSPCALGAESKGLSLVNTIDSSWDISAIVASPKSDMLLIQESSTWNVYLYSIDSGVKKELVRNLNVGVGVEGMCFSPDGSMCAVSTNESSDGSAGSIICVFNAKSGELISEISLLVGRGTIAFDKDNNLIAYGAISGSYGNYTPGITVRNARTGDILVGVESDGIKILCANPASNYFAAAMWGNTVKIYDSKTGGSKNTIEASSSIESMAYSANGKYLAISGYANTLILDAESNYSRVCEIGYAGRVSFNDSGEMLIIGDRVYFSADGFSDYTILTDGNNYIDTAFAFLIPDGKYYVNYWYGSQGIRLLDASKLLVRLQEIRLEPALIEFSPGEELEVKLTGIYTDGSSQGLNLRDVKLSVSDFSVAKINDNLKLQALTIGEAELSITYYGIEIKRPIYVVVKTSIPDPSGETSITSTASASVWAREGIESALDKGFVPQDLQNSYTSVITRGEFCRMAVKFVEYKLGKDIDTILAEKGLSRDPNAFADTSDPYILAAFALGITNGTAPNTFTPNGKFSREQAATMIKNTCKAAGIDANDIAPAGFIDMNSAADWSVEGINFCFSNGIMNGTGNNMFSPKGTYTREQSIITFDNIK